MTKNIKSHIASIASMVGIGRIPMTADEHEAVEKLIAKHGDQATLTRRDPNESGPILVHVGDDTYIVDGSKTRKAKG